MPKEFRFPDIGEGITEGEIVKWNVKEGDRINEHDVVGEIETDKAVAEIPSPYSGTVLKLNAKPGDTVKVGDVIFVIGEEGEKVSEEKVFKPAGAVGYLEEASDEIKPKTPVTHVAAAGPSVLATPVVRALAKQLNVDLSKVTGTGSSGRITEDDVKNFGKGGPEEKMPEIKITKKYDMWGYVDRVPLKGIRKSIAKRMIESVSHIPAVTAMDEVDVSDLVKIREGEKVRAQELGIKLTYLPFIMKACIEALKEFPLLNSSLEEETILVKKYYNIGFAVDVNGEGLVVPVIKGADAKSVYDIAKEMKELSDKARERKLDLQDMKGGTFTITNFGSIGGTFATPIINYPECAILGVGMMYDKPVAIEGEIVVRKVLPLSLTFDHRIVDGAYGQRFMNAVMSNLQEPEKFLSQ